MVRLLASQPQHPVAIHGVKTQSPLPASINGQAGIQVPPGSLPCSLTSLLELASVKLALCEEQSVLVVAAQQAAIVAR